MREDGGLKRKNAPNDADTLQSGKKKLKKTVVGSPSKSSVPDLPLIQSKQGLCIRKFVLKGRNRKAAGDNGSATECDSCSTLNESNCSATEDEVDECNILIKNLEGLIKSANDKSAKVEAQCERERIKHLAEIQRITDSIDEITQVMIDSNEDIEFLKKAGITDSDECIDVLFKQISHENSYLRRKNELMDKKIAPMTENLENLCWKIQLEKERLLRSECQTIESCKKKLKVVDDEILRLTASSSAEVEIEKEIQRVNEGTKLLSQENHMIQMKITKLLMVMDDPEAILLSL